MNELGWTFYHYGSLTMRLQLPTPGQNRADAERLRIALEYLKRRFDRKVKAEFAAAAAGRRPSSGPRPE